MANDPKNRAANRQRLEGVFREVFDDEKLSIADATTASDVEGWDSLAHITLIVNVEKEFGIRLSTAEIGNLKNVGDLLKLCVDRGTR